MTLFDLEQDDLGDWFAFFNSRVDPTSGDIIYDEPEEGAAEFRIRSMLPFWEEKQRNRKKQYKFVSNPTTRLMERVGYYEDPPPDIAKKENEDSWEYAITGIRNALKPDKTEIECNRENILKLIEIPVFIRFIQRVFEIMSEGRVRFNEESEKNSLNPQSGH